MINPFVGGSKQELISEKPHQPKTQQNTSLVFGSEHRMMVPM